MFGLSRGGPRLTSVLNLHVTATAECAKPALVGLTWAGALVRDTAPPRTGDGIDLTADCRRAERTGVAGPSRHRSARQRRHGPLHRALPQGGHWHPRRRATANARRAPALSA